MEAIFEAVLRGEKEVARLLRDDPATARTRASRDRLVEAIPHWLSAGDTSLHLAAAGLWTEVARVLLESGAEPNAQNRRGSTPIERYEDELEAYDTSKGTIRFQADEPLPAPLVRKLVKAQIAAKTRPSRRPSR